MARRHVEDVVDLDRYPIADRDKADYAALIADGRRQVAERGLCLFPGFLRREAVAAIVAEAERLTPRAFRREQLLDAYDRNPPPELPEDHPRRRRHPYRMGIIAQDLFRADGPLMRLYFWDGLTGFVSALLGRRLFRCADPLISCAVTVLGDGDEHGWHYDENDFVVSLLLQAAHSGGEFQFAPMIRSDTDENYDSVRRLFDGDEILLRRVALEPGTLALFQGRYSIHRVSPVGGGRARMIALLSYDSAPGMMFPAATRMVAVGRTE